MGGWLNTRCAAWLDVAGAAEEGRRLAERFDRHSGL
jgi:hypothetical protein